MADSDQILHNDSSTTLLNVLADEFHAYKFGRFRALAQFGCTNADIFLYNN